MPDQHDDLAKARKYLDMAAVVLEAKAPELAQHEMRPSDWAMLAATIGTGYAHVASVEQWANARDEDIARWTQQREDARPNDEVVEEANRLALERERRELALVEQRSDLLAALDLRDQRQREEARPHDDEGPGQAIPACEFVLDGKRCVFGAGHQVGYHHLEDGTDVDVPTGQTTEGADRG